MKNRERLWRVAVQQQGFFTAKQAKEAGYNDSNFGSHLQSGAWQRVERGIYCLSHFVSNERPELVIWSLWSQTNLEPGRGVWSHETALEFYDLSDVNPSKMHMTVPIGFRKKPPDFIDLHFGNLSPLEIQKNDGFFLTTPIRSLVDVFKAKALEPIILSQCVTESLMKGIITKEELLRQKHIYSEIKQILEIIHD